VLVLDAGIFGDVNRRAGRLDEAALAGEVVGMVVRLENVRVPKAVLLGDLQIVFYLPLGVYDRRFTAVGDDVGRATQVLIQYFSKEHAP
jgi:hypothetical protein